MLSISHDSSIHQIKKALRKQVREKGDEISDLLDWCKYKCPDHAYIGEPLCLLNWLYIGFLDAKRNIIRLKDFFQRQKVPEPEHLKKRLHNKYHLALLCSRISLNYSKIPFCEVDKEAHNLKSQLYMHDAIELREKFISKGLLAEEDCNKIRSKLWDKFYGKYFPKG